MADLNTPKAKALNKFYKKVLDDRRKPLDRQAAIISNYVNSQGEYKQGIIKETSEDVIRKGLAATAFAGTKFNPYARIALAIEDGVDGYNNPGKYFHGDTNDIDRISSTLGSIANGISFGFIPRDKATIGLARLLGSNTDAEEDYVSVLDRVNGSGNTGGYGGKVNYQKDGIGIGVTGGGAYGDKPNPSYAQKYILDGLAKSSIGYQDNTIPR